MPVFSVAGARARRFLTRNGSRRSARRRIYGKLDITTERELFLPYIEALSRMERQAPPSGQEVCSSLCLQSMACSVHRCLIVTQAV